MATMPFRANPACTVVYVDPSATGTNDGSTPANALTSFPLLTALVASRVYLVRRTATITWTPGTSSVDNLLVMGMPLPTDEYYSVVPAEAKSAWDADVELHPRVNIAQVSTACTFSGYHVGMHRLAFFNSCTAVVTSTGVLFSGTCVSITRCIYRAANEDLATLTSAGTTAASTVRCYGYMSITAAYARVADCEFHLWQGNTTLTGGVTNQGSLSINGTGTGIAIVENCVFRCITYAGTSPYTGTDAGVLFISKKYAIVRNLTYDVIENDMVATSTMFWRPLLHVSAANQRVDNITVTTRLAGTDTTARTATTASTWLTGQIIPLFYFSNVGTAATQGSHIEISNISVDGSAFMGAPSFLGVNNASGTAAAALVTANIGTRLLSIKNVSFTCPSTVRYSTSILGMCVPTSGEVVIDNCTVTYSGINVCAFKSASNDSVAHGGMITNVTLTGTIELPRAVGVADFLSVTVNGTDLVTPVLVGGGLIRVRSLTLPTDMITTAISVSGCTTLLIDNCNIRPLTSISNTYANIAIANCGITGAWSSFTTRAVLETSYVRRQGSAAGASLYGTFPVAQTPGNSDDAPAIGPYGFDGVPMAPGGTGVKTLKIYVASRYMTMEDAFRRLSIEVQYPFGGGSAVRWATRASPGVHFATDASTWIGDTGLTAYVLSVPVKVDRNEPLKIRLAFTPDYNQTGFMYIDPAFELV